MMRTTRGRIGRALVAVIMVAVSVWWALICPMGPVPGIVIVGVAWLFGVGIILWLDD